MNDGWFYVSSIFMYAVALYIISLAFPWTNSHWHNQMVKKRMVIKIMMSFVAWLAHQKLHSTNWYVHTWSWRSRMAQFYSSNINTFRMPLHALENTTSYRFDCYDTSILWECNSNCKNCTWFETKWNWSYVIWTELKHMWIARSCEFPPLVIFHFCGSGLTYQYYCYQ